MKFERYSDGSSRMVEGRTDFTKKAGSPQVLYSIVMTVPRSYVTSGYSGWERGPLPHWWVTAYRSKEPQVER